MERMIMKHIMRLVVVSSALAIAVNIVLVFS